MMKEKLSSSEATVQRSSQEKVLGKDCSKFAGEHPCRSVISIKLLCNFIEFALRQGFSPVNLLHIFGTPFPKNTSGRLFLVLGIFILTLSSSESSARYYLLIDEEKCLKFKFTGSISSNHKHAERQQNLNFALPFFKLTTS